MKTPTLRWAIYLLIAAPIFAAIRWLAAPVDGAPVTTSHEATREKKAEPSSAAKSSDWRTDLKEAEAEAKANHKLLFLNFTGSDWCGYCIQFDRAILDQPQFKQYANKNLVLLEVDFPRRNGPRWNAQSIELKKQNAQLAQQYEVDGFPTLVVLSPEGKTLWRYDGMYVGGVAAFLAELDKARKG
jgi:thioredoxin-related protein